MTHVTPRTEKWSATVRCGHLLEHVEVEVPDYTYAGEEIRKAASRKFDWPISDIHIEHARHVLTKADTVDPDAAGSAMVGDRFDGQG